MKRPLTESEVAERIYADCKWYIENNLYIRTKEGELRKLKLNRVQERLVEYVIDCLRRGLPVRAIILKARQEGVSTVIEAVVFWFTSTRKNISSRIIAHNTDATNNLFNMSKLFYDRLHPFVRPMRKYSNRKELVFANPSNLTRDDNPGLNSKISVSTAGNKEAGRSETNQIFHGSEVAFWENPDEIVAGMMQTIPMKKNTMAFLESTANGVGGFFYDTYQKAKRGESAFKAFFFPWWIHEEYSVEPEGDFDLTDEEKSLKEQLKASDGVELTDAQFNWRRMKMAEMGGSINKFEQEYPATDYEAFVTSGRPRFDVESLKGLLKGCKAPMVGELDKRTFRESKNGRFKVWEKPFPNMEYVVGVDVSEGLEKGDNSVIQVIDRKTSTQVAEFCGKIDPDKLGEMAYFIGRWYNDAFLGVESNNHGLTTLTILKQMNYPRLYYRRVVDDRKKKQTTKMGWHTNLKTKPLMIDEMAVWIREGLIRINSKELIGECLTYVVDGKGLTNAQAGCLDDRVTSFAIALQMYKLVSLDEEKDPIIKFGNRYTRR